MQGYIKLHRSILNNTIFKCKPFSKGQAWITLLLLTNYKEGYINVKNGEMIKVKRGECGYSELALADLFGWSRGKVKRFLELLKSEKMIHQKTVANRTIISILNYENYQNDTVNSTVNDTVNGHLTIHQTDINNNDKNDNNDKNIISLYKNQITEREREILYAYCKRQNIKNKNAFIRKLIDNGDYVYVVDEELKHQNYIAKLKEEEELQNKQNRKVEDPAFTEQAYLKFRETVTNRRSSRNETMGKSLGNVTVETCNNNGNNQ